MAASAAYSWGVSTAGDATTIPDVNSVFQWYGEATSAANIEINVLFREYTFKPTVRAGPVFAESKFTVEAAIRRCFDTAARMSVEKLAKAYDDRVERLINDRIKAGQNQQSASFKRLFEAMYDDGVERGQGLALFEPFEASKADPPIHIEGCVFANQGSRGAKRLRLIAETDGGLLCPVRIQLSREHILGQLEAQGRGKKAISPYGDVRLLAGPVQVGDERIFQLLQQFVNHLCTDVQYYSVFSLDDLGNQGNIDIFEFPTLLKSGELETICENINQSQTDCGAIIPFYGDKCIQLLQTKIDTKMAIYKNSIEAELVHLYNIFKYDRKQIESTNNGTHIDDDAHGNVEQREEHKHQYQKIMSAIKRLKTDPILWINGPQLSNQQGVEYKGENGSSQNFYISGESQQRQKLLAGFDRNKLRWFCHDCSDNDLKDAYNKNDANFQQTLLFSTKADELYEGYPDVTVFPNGGLQKTNTDNAKIIIRNSINTIYNILFTPGVAVRLSDWVKANRQARDVEANIDPQKSPDEPFVRTAEPPYHTLVSVPHHETRFRLSMLEGGSARLTSGLEAEDLSFDAAFKQFEYDMHVGDVAAYTNEVLTVIRLALECILIPVEDVATDGEEVDIREALYSGSTGDLCDRFIPVFNGVKATIRRHDTRMFDNVATVFDNKMSAAAYFVHRHIIKSIATPFDRSAIDRPSYNEVMALLASLNPFPVNDKYVREFIQKVLGECKDKLEESFKNAYHMVQQMEHTRPAEIQQPHQPFLVRFERTISKDKDLQWSVGSESTLMLEGMVLALNVINKLADASAGSDVDVNVVFPGAAPPMQLSFSGTDVETRERALTRLDIKIDGSTDETSRFRVNDYTYDIKKYFKDFLGFDDECGIQAGRFVHGKRPEGVVGVFEYIVNADVDGDVDPDVVDAKNGIDKELLDYWSSRFPNDGNTDTLNKVAFGLFDNSDKKVGMIVYDQCKFERSSSDLKIKVEGGCKAKVIFFKDNLVTLNIGDKFKLNVQLRAGIKTSSNYIEVIYTLSSGVELTQEESAEECIQRTNNFKLTSAIDHIPYKFTKQEKIDVSNNKLEETLLGGFNGLHFSNSRSLKRTILAVAIKDKYENLTNWLKQKVPHYPGDVNWAVHATEKGDGILLAMLHQAFENSTTRATDAPMADRVLVRCVGPGSADEPTPCYLENYYYRTGMFFQMEVKAMQIFRETVARHKCAIPLGSVKAPLARYFDTIHSLHDLLKRRDAAAPAVCKLMINLYEFEKVGHRSKGSRDKAALRIQSETIATDAHHILYRI